MTDIAFYEAFKEESETLARLLPSNVSPFFTWQTIQESGHKLPPAPIISVRTQSEIPLDWADRLSAIITRSTGYDHILDYQQKTGWRVPSAYLPDYAARAVAEHAIMLCQALSRGLLLQLDSFRTFHRDGLSGREMRGRRIAVIGVGRIGSQIVEIASGLGMIPCGVDLNPREDLARRFGLRYMPLEDALALAEIAVCALPLTKLTRGLLALKKLSLMQEGSIFVNVGRGEISPSEDILSLVSEGRFLGVGLDVFDSEKELASVLRDGKNPSEFAPHIQKSVEASIGLMRTKNVILTPHNAFNTEESVERKSADTVGNLLSFIKTGNFISPILRNLEI